MAVEGEDIQVVETPPAEKPETPAAAPVFEYEYRGSKLGKEDVDSLLEVGDWAVRESRAGRLAQYQEWLAEQDRKRAEPPKDLKKETPAGDEPPAWAKAYFERVDKLEKTLGEERQERSRREGESYVNHAREVAQGIATDLGIEGLSREQTGVLASAYLIAKSTGLSDDAARARVRGILDVAVGRGKALAVSETVRSRRGRAPASGGQPPVSKTPAFSLADVEGKGDRSQEAADYFDDQLEL